MAFSDYQTATMRALMTFQFIEESIKMYLVRAYAIYAKKLGPTFPFRPAYKELATLPLQKLLVEFRKFNKNDELISELKQMSPARNDLAHKGFLLTYDEIHDDAEMKRLAVKADAVHKKSRKCLFQLLAEVKQLEELAKTLSKPDLAPRSST